jgi:hypothetical protein
MSGTGQTISAASIGIPGLRDMLIKQHMVYDVSNRLSYLYEAVVEAKHGEKCLVTHFHYSGTTSLVTDIKEDNSTWDSAWDL